MLAQGVGVGSSILLQEFAHSVFAAVINAMNHGSPSGMQKAALCKTESDDARPGDNNATEQQSAAPTPVTQGPAAVLTALGVDAQSSLEALASTPRYVRVTRKGRGKVTLASLQAELTDAVCRGGGRRGSEGCGTTVTNTPFDDFFALPSQAPVGALPSFAQRQIVGLDLASGLAVRVLLQDLAPAPAPCAVLDLCCAPGGKLQYIAECLAEGSPHPGTRTVTGVDVSAERLGHCAARVRQSGLCNVRLIRGDGTCFNAPAPDTNEFSRGSVHVSCLRKKVAANVLASAARRKVWEGAKSGALKRGPSPDAGLREGDMATPSEAGNGKRQRCETWDVGQGRCGEEEAAAGGAFFEAGEDGHSQCSMAWAERGCPAEALLDSGSTGGTAAQPSLCCPQHSPDLSPHGDASLEPEIRSGGSALGQGAEGEDGVKGSGPRVEDTEHVVDQVAHAEGVGGTGVGVQAAAGNAGGGDLGAQGKEGEVVQKTNGKHRTSGGTGPFQAEIGAKEVTMATESSAYLSDEAGMCRGYCRVFLDAECSADASLPHLRRALDIRSSGKSPSQEQPAVSVGPALQATQRSLIARGYCLLRRGGVLVYATCSMRREQNEEIVEWLLGQHRDAKLEEVDLVGVQAEWCGTQRQMVKLGPQISGTSGLFIARIRKPV